MTEEHCDVLVVGGGTGGVAAALAAAGCGSNTILTEPGPWLGGQLTSQGVPPDENPWVESFGSTRQYARFRDGVREHYRQNRPLTPSARRDRHLNPGTASVSRISHEPEIAATVLDNMIAPHVAAGRLRVLRHTDVVAAETDQDRISAVSFSDGRTVSAQIVLDATEEGQLVALAGAEHALGAESQDETGELHAPRHADPQDQQAITWCMAVEHRPGEDHTIDRPKDYEFWRSYQPPIWPGRTLSFTWPHPPTLEPRTAPLFADENAWSLWRYRRIRDARHYEVPVTDASVINWPQNDYFVGPIIGVDEQTRARHLAGAQQLTLSLLYWLQTEAPRHDDGVGYPELKPLSRGYGRPDGLAWAPYVRESRRIKAMTTVVEEDVAVHARAPQGGARTYEDSVGIGSYHVDLHPSASGRNYVDFQSLPFEIPLGTLIPIRLTNLLAAGKAIGSTHLTNGCYRLHPVEWSIGEAAGTAAAYCSGKGITTHALYGSHSHREALQQQLKADGVHLHWPLSAVEEALGRVKSLGGHAT